MRLVFILVAFLMMLGAIIGGLYFWGIDPLAKLNVLIGNAPADPNVPKVEPVKPPAYVDFGLLVVPVIQDHEVKKQVEMIVRLEVPANKKDLVANNLPRLQDAFLREMMEFLSVQMRDNQPLDVAATRQKLLQVGQKLLQPDLLRDVVIESPIVH
jgi:hypothetical protein